MVFLCFFFVTFLSHHWDTIIGSISFESVLISVLTVVSLSQVLSKLYRLSCDFSSLGHYPRCYLGLLFVHSVFSSLGKHPWFCLYLCFIPLVSHPQDFILCSNFNRFFLCFCINATPSQVLSQFILYSFCFSPLESYHRFYLSLMNCMFGFSSIGHHPRFNVSLFFVHFISHLWDAILGSI